MSNYAKALKEEVTRIARKEIRQENTSLKKKVSMHSSEIASLKRRSLQLEKDLAAMRKILEKAAPSEQPEVAVPRITTKGFIALRKRLGLSAESMAKLLNVSSATVYNYESGTQPRKPQLERIAVLKTKGKREVSEILSTLG